MRQLRLSQLRKLIACMAILTLLIGALGLTGSGPAAALSVPGQQPGYIYTVAGNGTYGYSGDNDQATSAEISMPNGIAVDKTGDLFIPDSNNNRIREVAATTGTQYGISMTAGDIYTVAGSANKGYFGDDGPATSAELNNPCAVALDASGNLYFSDNANHRIRKVDTSGVITSVAGNGTSGYNGDNIQATQAELKSPQGVAVDASGNLYISDYGNNRIFKVDTGGIITTVAGNGTSGYNGDNIQATQAELKSPYGVTVDTTGNLYIADMLNNRIRKVDTSGIITTVAGNGTKGYTEDNVMATNSELSYPSAVALDAAGNLYISEYSNYRIRKVDTSGIITTVAGNGTYGYYGDNVPATSAEFENPSGVAIDASGNLYINDHLNSRICMVAASAQDSSISLTSATFDQNVNDSVYHADIPVTVTSNGNTLTSITNNGYTLASGTDYSVLGDVYTINTSYLDTLSTGTTDLTFNFSTGNPQTLTVTVEDTTPASPAASPAIDPASGSYPALLTVTISDDNLSVGQAVYYSTAGNPESVGSYNWASPLPYSFTLDHSATVYAQVYSNGSWGSPVSAAYTMYSQSGSTDTLDATDQNPLNGAVTVPLPSADGHAVAINLGGNVSLNIPAGANLPASITVSETAGGTGNVFVLSASGGSYSDGFGTDVSIALPIPAGLSNPQVYYQVSPGIYELLDGTVNGNGTVTFTTSHFSTYAVATGSAAQPTASPSTGTYSGSKTVTLSSSGAAKLLYYTTTGTAPTGFDYSQNYTTVPAGSTTLTVSSSENLVAVGVDANGFCSAPLIASYTINTSSGGGGGGGGGVVSYKPAINTGAATSVTTNSAVLSGTITTDNGYDVTDYGFLWGTSQGSLTNKLAVGTDNHSGSFTATLDSLTAGQTYYFQAYATNSQGTTAGPVMNFTAAAASQTTVPTPAPTSGSGQVFSDVLDSFWGYQAISSLSSQGIVAGYPDGTFKPNASITRAEFAAMLVKAMKIDSGNTTGQFTDVTAKDWCYGAVNAAAASGLVSGTGDHLFSPNTLITREQMAAMIVRAMGSKAPTVSGSELDAFGDQSAVSTWAVSGMEQAVKASIVSGMSAGTLAPQANATRAQAAGMIYKLLSVLGK